MIRDIVVIDEERCNGCGDCIPACHEGALRLINGKARLVADNVCDGLGACLGHCPQGAIRVVRREAESFNPLAVERLQVPTRESLGGTAPHGSCPGSTAIELRIADHRNAEQEPASSLESELSSWPIKLRLLNPTAPFLKNARLLIAADCVPVALPAFQRQMLQDRIPIIGCPKFDDPREMIDRLTAIVTHNELAEVAVVRMVVPCCRGIALAAQEAIVRAHSNTPFTEIVVSLDGHIEQERTIVLGGRVSAC